MEREEMEKLIEEAPDAVLASTTLDYLRHLIKRGVISMEESGKLMVKLLMVLLKSEARRETLKQNIAEEPRIVLPKDR